ncbi:UNVERIFIED_ORG: hypothetical protein ABIB52_004539 [Arthrobacter sp. UYCu721]
MDRPVDRATTVVVWLRTRVVVPVPEVCDVISSSDVASAKTSSFFGFQQRRP